MLSTVTDLLASYGLLALGAVVFIETGLLIGFFLPGDSLLFTAGMLSGMPDPFAPVWQIIAVVAVCGFLGDQLGYYIGRKSGPYILKSRAARMIGEKRITAAEEFFERHGAVAVILARFVPVIRTIVPVLAGITAMNYRTFTIYNLIGGLAWSIVVPVAGYYLGGIEFIRAHIDLILIAIVALSVIPLAIQYFTSRRNDSDSSV